MMLFIVTHISFFVFVLEQFKLGNIKRKHLDAIYPPPPPQESPTKKPKAVPKMVRVNKDPLNASMDSTTEYDGNVPSCTFTLNPPQIAGHMTKGERDEDDIVVANKTLIEGRVILDTHIHKKDLDVD